MDIKDVLVKKLASKTKLDYRVVRLIADYPIKFTKERISNSEDTRAVMIRYFAKFVPKANGNEHTRRKELNKTTEGDTEQVDKEQRPQVQHDDLFL